MTDSQFATALPDGTAADKLGLRGALIQRVIYATPDSEDPQAYTAVDAVTGAQPIGLAFMGLIFWFDPDDLTSPHDGTTVIVTADGWRYKRTGLEFIPRSVIDKDLTVPPTGSPPPAFGDAYIVPAGATGDWAGHEDEIAIWSPRLEWAFVLPQIGMLIFVEDEAGFYHYSVTGDWTPGVGQSALSDDTIKTRHIQGGGGRVAWVVVNQTTNDPPGSPAVGVAYIIGPAPTGDWAGHAVKIATWEGSEWGVYQPANGWSAYDQAQNSAFRFDGSAWVSQAGAIIFTDHVFTASGSTTGVGTSAYAYSSGTAPTTSNNRLQDDATMVRAARKAGAVLEFTYDFNGTESAVIVAPQSIALFRDSEVNAIAWSFLLQPDDLAVPFAFNRRFVATAPDSAAHTYRIAIVAQSASAGARVQNLTRRLFELRERS